MKNRSIRMRVGSDAILALFRRNSAESIHDYKYTSTLQRK